MKSIIIGIALATTILAACNGNSYQNGENKKMDAAAKENNSIPKDAPAANTKSTTVNTAMQGMVSQYLQIKNGLADDNGKDAASAGNAFVVSMDKMPEAPLTAAQKKIWDGLFDDAKEMAEHIGKNADKLEHQREHFDMLSQDMYDMVKAFGGGQTLYQDFCPMYNDKKGATWLSETKEIKNPYLGKKMPTCGSVKEEIK
ncbi:MAG: DUF3347 domain-containing protein [Ferruginibacter sp.]|nr:DUF3347 domain-containing protein [Ferruginibacter sp.]